MRKNKKETEAVETDQVLTDEDLYEADLPKEEKPEVEENDEKSQELEQAIQKQNEYLALAQQIQADFENYKKRSFDMTTNARRDGLCFAVEKLLPVLDSIASAKRQITDESFLASLDLIYKQTLDCFDRMGVKKIEAVGKPFDPNLHNAVFTEHVEGTEPDMVLDELQEGFILDDKVIRHSVVKVSE